MTKLDQGGKVMSVTSGGNCIFQSLEAGKHGRNLGIYYPFGID